MIAKVGELVFPHQGKQLRKDGLRSFSRPTLADYRKVAAHKDKLPAYRAAVESEVDREMTLAGFLSYVGPDAGRRGVADRYAVRASGRGCGHVVAGGLAGAWGKELWGVGERGRGGREIRPAYARKR